MNKIILETKEEIEYSSLTEREKKIYESGGKVHKRDFGYGYLLGLLLGLFIYYCEFHKF